MKPSIITVEPKICSLAAMHEGAIRVVRKNFAEQGATAYMWFIRGRNHMAFVETNWGNDFEKEASVRCLQGWLAASGATGYSFVSEAFKAVIPANSDGGLPDDIRPASEHPDRRDVVFVTSVSHKGRRLVTEIDVAYPDDPAFGVLGDRDDWNLGGMKTVRGGLLANLFDVPPEARKLSGSRSKFDSILGKAESDAERMSAISRMLDITLSTGWRLYKEKAEEEAAMAEVLSMLGLTR